MRFLLPILLVAAPFTVAAAEPNDAVHAYFAALDRQDFSRALAYTDGDAKGRTWRMVEKLRSEAAAHHARVELKVKRLDVRDAGAAEPGRGVPIPVAFHIDIVGHRWCFSKIARQLDGEARFYLDPERPDRIVAIEGRLDW
jgi:hypothetical protein